MGRAPKIYNTIACLWLACVAGVNSVQAFFQPPASLLEKQQQRIEVIKQIAPTVVCVMPPGGQGGGSGVLISADGYAISNYHVTSGSGNFMKAGLNDGKLYDAVIVGIDPTGDVALIRLLGRNDFPFSNPGDSDLVKAGDEVMALGNPFLLASDFSPTVTYGIVSGVQRYQYPAGSYLEYTDCIQIDASINPGNSGGPLFDIQGNWIGINGRASFEKRGRVNSGAAYAISVRQVLLFIDQLKSGRIVDHGRTDFTVRTASDGVVEVDEVSQISEARRRGMRPGDELISFAGRALSTANDFKNVVGIFPAGTRLPFKYRNRDGVYEGTVRLNPLHEFDAAPPIPGGPPGPQPGPEKPGDGEEEGDPEESPIPFGRPPAPREPDPPAEFAHLFEEKASFANYYFNRVSLEEVLNPLKDLIGANSNSESRTWSLRLRHPNAQIKTAGELLVGKSAAGLLGDNWDVAHQTNGKLDASDEPLQFYGLLAGSLHWFELFQNDWEQFSDVVYHGAEKLYATDTTVEVVIVNDAERTARWYFEDGSPLPLGFDLAFSAGADEARLRFRQWHKDGDVPWPGEIGIVDNDTELITWLTVEAMSVKAKQTGREVVK